LNSQQCFIERFPTDVHRSSGVEVMSTIQDWIYATAQRLKGVIVTSDNKFNPRGALDLLCDV